MFNYKRRFLQINIRKFLYLFSGRKTETGYLDDVPSGTIDDIINNSENRLWYVKPEAAKKYLLNEELLTVVNVHRDLLDSYDVDTLHSETERYYDHVNRYSQGPVL